MTKIIEDKKIEEIINLDSSIDNYYIEFLCMSDNEQNNKQIMQKFLNEICFSENDNGKRTGILYKNGYLQDSIDHHNEVYGRYFKKCELTDFGPLIKIDLLKESKQYKQGKFNINFADIFSKKNLLSLSEIELCAYTMQWSNRASKYVEKIIKDNYSDKEKSILGSICSDLRTQGLDSEFCMNYQYFKDMKDKDIKEQMEEDEFERYKLGRRSLREKLKESKYKDLDFETVIQYATLNNCKNKLYSIKDSMIRELVYKIEKGENTKAKHYVRKDFDAESSEKDYTYIYGITYEGYSEPFEVHVCTNETRASRFSKVISNAEERLTSEKITKKKIKIPEIYTKIVKSGLPFKLNYEQRKNVERSSIYFKGDSQISIANNILNSDEIYRDDFSRHKSFYTSSGIEEVKIEK